MPDELNHDAFAVSPSSNDEKILSLFFTHVDMEFSVTLYFVATTYFDNPFSISLRA